MKPTHAYVFSLFVLLSWSLSSCIQLRLRRTRAEPSADELKNYLTALEVPALPDEIWKPDSNEMNPSKDISNIATTLDLAKVKEKKNSIEIRWPIVKRNFAKAEDKTTIKTFMHLRYMDIMQVIKKVFGGEGYSTSNCNPQTFNNKIEEFSTPCVIVQVGPLSSDSIKGRFVFTAKGSQSTTSDIDFDVRFESSAGVYQRLYAQSKFIRDFNNKFQEFHGRNSLETYDINLYSSGFANGDVILELNSLRTETSKWKSFVNANRLAQMLLVYNDALVYYTDLQKNDKILAHLNALASASKDGNEDCSKYLLTLDGTTDGSREIIDPRSKRRSSSINAKVTDDRRNEAATIHVHNAGTENENTFRKMCHLLAANFFAPEAYVSYGSIVEMLMIQSNGEMLNNLNGANKGKATKFANNLDQNAVVDYILMNFAYGVEHYLEQMSHNNEDDAISKLAKYFARIYASSPKLKNDEHKKCWSLAIQKKLLNDVKENPPKEWDKLNDFIKNLKGKIATEFKNEDPDERKKKAKELISEGYKCANKYGWKTDY